MVLSRNDAYLIAKKAWKIYSRKRNHLEQSQCLSNTIIKLRQEGRSEEDIDLVSKWIKALRRGQKYPEEFLK